MWASIPIFCWPSVWLSVWWAGAATATAYRLPQTLVPPTPQRLRTPLLRLHVSTLKPNPHAGMPKRCEMQACPLHLVKPD